MYSFVTAGEVVHLMISLGRRDRDFLMRAFASLSENPFQSWDYEARAADGRTLFVKRFGPWPVTFWPDHAPKEVRVVFVKRVVP